MAVQIECPNCKRTYSVADDSVGKTAKCKACATSFSVGPSAGAPAPQPAPQIIEGRYQVRSELGRGAFGVVYRAYDQKMGREVAIKMLHPEALNSQEAVQRFLLEAKVLAELGHPNIVPIFEKGQHDRSYFLVFKMIKGKPLSSLIPKGGIQDPRVAVRYAITLARTLHAVFQGHKILHRDIKPANMMLEEDHLYLMDFGLAVCQDRNPVAVKPGEDPSQATVAGTIIGTPAYMPPEQACYNRAQIGPWSDLYSAGAVLYHCLTGTVPLPWQGTILDILQTIPPPPSSRRPGLDLRLDRIVLKALEKRPQDRYQTGQEFAEALQNWLDNAGSTSAAPIGQSAPPRPAELDSVQGASTLQNRPQATVVSATPAVGSALNHSRLWLIVGGILVIGALLVCGGIGGVFAISKFMKSDTTRKGEKQEWAK